MEVLEVAEREAELNEVINKIIDQDLGNMGKKRENQIQERPKTLNSLDHQ